MAALHNAAVTTITTTTALHHRFTFTTLNSRKPILLVSSSFTSIPTKPTTRKNHLRQKILKTLRKPLIPKLPLSNPIIPVVSPPLLTPVEEIQEHEWSENTEAINEEIQEFEGLREIEISVPNGVSVNGSFYKNQILKYGPWLLGAFVFQTVCAIWAFNSAGYDNKNQILNGTEKNSVLEVGGDDKGKSSAKFGLNGNGSEKMGVVNSAVGSIVRVDELEMEMKIEEIQAMARKARERERLESKKNGVDGEGNYFKSDIEEEVNEKLIKRRRELRKTRGNIPVATGDYSRKRNEVKDGVEKSELDEIDSDGGLLYKKYKFKGDSGVPQEKPKGFTGSDDTRLKSGNAVHVVEEDKIKGMSDTTASSTSTTAKVAKERETSKQETEKGLAEPKVVNGTALEKVSEKKSDAEAVKSRNSSASGIAVESNKLSKGNDFWWLNLPYVLVIRMRRGQNGEHGEGLYTLKSISSTDNPISHKLAFEDQTDAKNFCYILQSYFEDLDDFNAEVVPLPVKELNEDVKSYKLKVLVVKKGQLQLYAGQPLTDVETTLRDMIKTD